MGYLVENLVNALANVLAGDGGVGSVLGDPAYRTDSDMSSAGGIMIRTQALSADAGDGGLAKPAEIAVYCEKLRNQQREKFRPFSGNAQLAVELRASESTAALTNASLQKYVEGVLQVLHTKRGDWGDGMFFGGGYEVTFQPAKKGGKNYVQTAKVTLSVDYSGN
ncbi:MAG: hypothetical protein HY820_10975 [Acidobacteria bacterium]|nr:hypothetical protein [Acidobacteriota bacterium]